MSEKLKNKDVVRKSKFSPDKNIFAQNDLCSCRKEKLFDWFMRKFFFCTKALRKIIEIRENS